MNQRILRASFVTRLFALVASGYAAAQDSSAAAPSTPHIQTVWIILMEN